MTTFTHTTFAQAKTQLAALLGDSSKVFWTDTELGLYIKETLRTWGLGTGYWKTTAQIPLSQSQAFYDIMQVAEDSLTSTLLQSSTLTDRDIINDICYALMETPITTWAGGWVGTEQFTLDQIVLSLQRSRDELLALTGLVATSHTYPLTGGQSRVDLSESTTRVLRVVVEEDGSTGQPLPLWEADEGQLQSTSGAWLPQTGRPKAFSTTYTPTLSLDVWPPCNTQSLLTVYGIDKGTSFTPTSSATVLGIPDDCAWILKYMVIADIVSSDGISAAPPIAEYATARVKEGLDLIAQYQSLLWAGINQARSPITSVAGLDTHRPSWQSLEGTPKSFYLLTWNLLASYPVPDTSYLPISEMVRKAIVPTLDADYIQVSSDLMPVMLSFAQHLAHVKLQGIEFIQTLPLQQALMERASIYNSAASAKSLFYPSLQWRVKANRWNVPFTKPEVAAKVYETLKEN